MGGCFSKEINFARPGTLSKRKIKACSELQRWQLVHDAILKNDLATCEKLLKAGHPVNDPLMVPEASWSTLVDCGGVRLIHAAALHRRPQILQLLLNFGADPNILDDLGRSALHISVMYWPNFRDEVIESSSTVSREKESYRRYADSIRNRSIECVELLCKHGIDVNIVSDLHPPPIHLIASFDAVDILHTICEYGADVDLRDKTLLYTPIFVATKNGNVRVMKALIDRGADYTHEIPGNRTLLHVAARIDNTSDTDCIKLLLRLGLDPNAQDASGFTPFHVAARQKNWSALQLLLEYGANPEILSNAGTTAVFEYMDTLLLGDLRGRTDDVAIPFWPMVIETIHPNITPEKLPRFFTITNSMGNDVLPIHVKDALAYFEHALVGNQPADLKDICRHVIRRVLTKCFHSYPCIKQVEQLPLPRIIKDYLIEDVIFIPYIINTNYSY
ncbi:ankyrin repeat domain-containing protein 61-like [Saccoglossus kowalevskii]|uniref:Ankyrin repeat domain-containing protein 61-like n=1 Tax=Saccoglossus kowalevskii TaxID=10224 RepID=A0ABM0M6V3_SACKO|nr:PREDICTED: ankyrin repeat domain-containing protein 61-like [Saccoglossus kowalevskii]